MSEENSKPAEDQAAEQQEGQEGQPQVHFGLQRLYLKDLSFEAPLGVEAFTKEWKPAVNQEMGTAINKLDDNNYECELTITVTVKLEEKTAFLVEVQQAGVFNIVGLPTADLPLALEIACPNILLPFAREAVSDLVGKAGFPQLLLTPINFEGLYQQKLQHQAAAAEKQGETV